MSASELDLTTAESNPLFLLVQDTDAFYEFTSDPDADCPCGDCDWTVGGAALSVAGRTGATLAEGYLALYLVSVQGVSVE